MRPRPCRRQRCRPTWPYRVLSLLVLCETSRRPLEPLGVFSRPFQLAWVPQTQNPAPGGPAQGKVPTSLITLKIGEKFRSATKPQLGQLPEDAETENTDDDQV